MCNDLVTLRFNDHHRYTRRDFENIKRNFDDIYTRNKLLITTEKDAMRMLNPEVRELAAEMPIYYMPMEIDFHNGDKKIFDETINKYVRENKRER
jgi:tetraacyldisaccharide 4'-kinase